MLPPPPVRTNGTRPAYGKEEVVCAGALAGCCMSCFSLGVVCVYSGWCAGS